MRKNINLNICGSACYTIRLTDEKNLTVKMSLSAAAPTAPRHLYISCAANRNAATKPECSGLLPTKAETGRR